MSSTPADDPGAAWEFTTDDPCPAYCSLPPGHPTDSDHLGHPCRGHGGPLVEFGDQVAGGSFEYLASPRIYFPVVQVGNDLTFRSPAQLLDLVRELVDAARWLMENSPGVPENFQSGSPG